MSFIKTPSGVLLLYNVTDPIGVLFSEILIPEFDAHPVSNTKHPQRRNFIAIFILWYHQNIELILPMKEVI